MTKEVEIQKIVAVSDALLSITDEVKILRNIAWDDHVQQEFFSLQRAAITVCRILKV